MSPALTLPTDLVPALLQLHKALLDEQRRAHEATHGPTTPNQLFGLVTGDPAFQWLRELSALIVQTEEAAEQGDAALLATGLAALRTRLAPADDVFGQRLAAALAATPAASEAHRRTLAILGE